MHGEVNQKKLINEKLEKSVFLLVGIRGGILVLLKFIIGLVCLVLTGVVYIVSTLQMFCYIFGFLLILNIYIYYISMQV